MSGVIIFLVYNISISNSWEESDHYVENHSLEVNFESIGNKAEHILQKMH